MATRYWVANGGNWSDAATHWASTSGGLGNAANLPTAGDDVVFNALSFSAAGQTVVADAPTSPIFNAMTWTGVLNNPTFRLDATVFFYGDVTLAAAMTMSGSSQLFYISLAGMATLNPVGCTIPSLIGPRYSGATLTLAGVLNVGSFAAGDGIFNSGGYAINATGSVQLGSTGSGRANLGSSAITCNSFTAASGISYFVDAANATVNAATNFAGGGRTYRVVNLTGTGTSNVTGSNTFSYFGTTSAPKTIQFSNGTTQTILNTFNVNGTALNNVTLRLNGVSGSWAISKASGTVNANYLTISSSNATGGAVWYAANSTNLGGNTGWIFTGVPVPAVRYWVGNGGSWTDSAHWATTSAGPGGAPIPTYVDDVIFDAGSFSIGGQVVTGSGGQPCKGMTWATVNYGPTFESGCDPWGNVVLSAGMTLGAVASFTLHGTAGTLTFTPATRTIYNLTVAGPASWQIIGTLSIGHTLAVSGGGIDLNGQTVSVNGAIVVTGTANVTSGAATITCGSMSDLGSGTKTWSGSTVNTPGDFVSSGATYGSVNLTGISPCRIGGNNTFGTLSFPDHPKTVTFDTGSIQTISSNLVANGSFGNWIVMKGSLGSGSWYLVKTSGTITCNYLSLTNSAAYGGALWYAVDSLNVSGNSGWTFSGTPPVPSGARPLDIISFSTDF